ncbi:unnamed protein product [Miscanthus lutarioriparius]|uniref:Uncharacterized protein n=1 Tax=Miscanthus lutarioriparius TaxID=422564 RepID=A0A811QY90_9POAL|nr:unnamed protein product [Miscanthus lutarioriparius]
MGRKYVFRFGKMDRKYVLYYPDLVALIGWKHLFWPPYLFNGLTVEFDVLMESKGGKKSSSSHSMMYEAPLGYSIEDVRPAGGVKKFQSAAYSNCAKRPS